MHYSVALALLSRLSRRWGDAEGIAMRIVGSRVGEHIVFRLGFLMILPLRTMQMVREGDVSLLHLLPRCSLVSEADK